MLGFEALTRKLAGDIVPDAATQAFRRPVPRLAEGIALAPLAGAMMDLSDGLLIDARRLALASGVTLALQSAAVPLPVSPAFESLAGDRQRAAMTWGDDYELLFTLPPGTAPPCLAHAIGTVEEFCGDSLLLDGAVPKGRLGYRHD
jgi:thiamine-monophosphate kinase